MKVEVDETLAKRFRKRAMEKYGYRRGAMKKALEETMKYSQPGKVGHSAMNMPSSSLSIVTCISWNLAAICDD